MHANSSLIHIRHCFTNEWSGQLLMQKTTLEVSFPPKCNTRWCIQRPVGENNPPPPSTFIWERKQVESFRVRLASLHKSIVAFEALLKIIEKRRWTKYYTEKKGNLLPSFQKNNFSWMIWANERPLVKYNPVEYSFESSKSTTIKGMKEARKKRMNFLIKEKYSGYFITDEKA